MNFFIDFYFFVWYAIPKGGRWKNVTQGERVKEVRKNLGLTLEKFGERIGLKKNTMSAIETGRNALTDANIKAICREFGVDYIFLTTGEGEMFVDSDDDFIEKIDRIMAGESDIRKNAIKALVNASTEDIEALDRLIDLYLQAKNEKDWQSFQLPVSFFGVKIQNEFIYPLEDFFTMYLSD